MPKYKQVTKQVNNNSTSLLQEKRPCCFLINVHALSKDKPNLYYSIFY